MAQDNPSRPIPRRYPPELRERAVRLMVELDAGPFDQHFFGQQRAFFGQDFRRPGQRRPRARRQDVFDQQVGGIVRPAMDDAALRPARLRFVRVDVAGD
jgi:hypothetical protein